MTTATLVPLPAGATRATDWEVNADESITRTFWGTERARDHRWYIAIMGEQAHGGEVINRAVYVNTVEISEGELGDAELGDLAADLLATRDELRALSGQRADVIELRA